MNEIRVIGITGGIGSGKTTVAKYIESQGKTVIYTDIIAKDIIADNKTIHKKIAEAFGNTAFNTETGKIDSAFIASLVFGTDEQSQKNLNILNSIVHPAVIDCMLKQIEKSAKDGCEIIFVECALIYELALEEGFDYIIDVYAEKEICIKRVMARNNMTREQAENRLAVQMTPELKKTLADFVIENNKSLKELQASTDMILLFL